MLKQASSGQQARELNYLMEQSAVIFSNAGAENDNDSDVGSASDEESESGSEESDDIVQELGCQIGYLVELAPTLHKNRLSAQKARLQLTYPPIKPFSLSNPALVYVSMVRERYRNAHERLIDRLGVSNWQRHTTMRKQMEELGSHPDHEDTEVPYSVFRPYSAFHDSGIGTTVPAHSEYARSHTSFQSSIDGGDQGAKKVPPTPEAVAAGKPFRCHFCGRIQSDIRSRIDWKLVFIHLVARSID